ncbi:MAG: hypothetical protein ACK4MI_03905 [Brevundimonas sp.]|uniref:hypothetical protein n=1 Tax=Brevundimonas sp. TaxID=1871086 RepID=UPI0039192608
MSYRRPRDREFTAAETAKGKAALAAADVLETRYFDHMREAMREYRGCAYTPTLSGSLRGFSRAQIESALGAALFALNELVRSEDRAVEIFSLGKDRQIDGHGVEAISFHADAASMTVDLTWHEDDVVTFERGGGNNFERTVYMWRPDGGTDLLKTLARVAGLFFEKAQRKGFSTLDDWEPSDDLIFDLYQDGLRSGRSDHYFERHDGALIL